MSVKCSKKLKENDTLDFLWKGIDNNKPCMFIRHLFNRFSHLKMVREFRTFGAYISLRLSEIHCSADVREFLT